LDARMTDLVFWVFLAFAAGGPIVLTLLGASASVCFGVYLALLIHPK
jgi:hypothetical protein